MYWCTPSLALFFFYPRPSSLRPNRPILLCWSAEPIPLFRPIRFPSWLILLLFAFAAGWLLLLLFVLVLVHTHIHTPLGVGCAYSSSHGYVEGTGPPPPDTHDDPIYLFNTTILRS